MIQNEAPLNVAVLRLSGDDAAMDEVVRKLGLNVATRSEAGSPRRRGGFNAVSTLNASIADVTRPAAMLEEVRTFLPKCHGHGATLFASGVHAELSIGVSVGDSGQFIASVDLSTAEIRDFAALGISLNFTAYPRSDEGDDSSEQSQPGNG